jgi:hypothetical protein
MTDSRPTIPKIHAILVGINAYAEQRSLKSAVKDAQAFKKVLEKLDSDSTLLLDIDAKHESIITALDSLQYKDGLTRDDAIVFFFSGYAGSAKDAVQEDGKEDVKEGRERGPEGGWNDLPDRFHGKGWYFGSNARQVVRSDIQGLR